MRKTPLFIRLKSQHQQQRIKNTFYLEFNDEHFAIATPEFWDAWNAEKNSTRGRTLSRQYALAKYRADQIGQSGKKPVWVVFANWSAKEAFEAKLDDRSTPAPENTNDEKLTGLGWQCTKANGGMFFDDRNPKNKGVLVAWLNFNRGVYSVNIVSDTFQLKRPIPRSISDLSDAVEWVYHHAVWVQ